MKNIVLFVLIIVAQYACESNETQILDSKIAPPNPLNITRNKHIRDIDDCQKPSFANYTRGNKKFITVDDDTFEEYLKTVNLKNIDGLREYDQFKNWTPPEQLKKDFPLYLVGYDPENRPIFVIEVGKFQIVKYFSGGGEMQALVAKYLQYLAYQILKAMAFKSTKEKPVHQFIDIVDCEGIKPEFVLNLAALKSYLKALKPFYNVYEYRYRNVTLNLNPIAEIILNILYTTTDKRKFDYNKFVVYGTDRAFWVPKLVQMFGKYQLPEKYGGCKGLIPTNIV